MKDNISKETGNFLFSLIKNMKCKNILEIGTGTGFSTKFLAKSNGNVITIEISKNRYEKARENLKEFKNIKLIKGDALKVLPKIKNKFDFVFIDASKNNYLNFLRLIEKNKLMKKNCIIVADNVISHEEKVIDYLDYTRKNYKSKLVNIGKGLEVSFK